MGIETEQGKSDDDTKDTPGKSSVRKKSGKKKAPAKPKNKTNKPRTSKGGRPGPGTIVKQLVEEGFFKTAKTTQDIIDHCKSKHAFTYNTNELSVAMTRALRNQSLKRQKNEQKQFEYYE